MTLVRDDTVHINPRSPSGAWPRGSVFVDIVSLVFGRESRRAELESVIRPPEGGLGRLCPRRARCSVVAERTSDARSREWGPWREQAWSRNPPSCAPSPNVTHRLAASGVETQGIRDSANNLPLSNTVNRAPVESGALQHAIRERRDTQLREGGFDVRDGDVARRPFVRHHINMGGTPSSSPTCPGACARCVNPQATDEE